MKGAYYNQICKEVGAEKDMEAGYTKDYCVWVDTSNKVASFHSVEKGRPMQFEQHTTFMAYLNSLVTQGYRFQ